MRHGAKAKFGYLKPIRNDGHAHREHLAAPHMQRSSRAFCTSVSSSRCRPIAWQAWPGP